MKFIKPVFILGLLFITNSALAAVIECGAPPRIAFLGDISGPCATGAGNPQVTDIETYFGGDWLNIAELEGSDGVSGLIGDDLFSADLLYGEWGSAPAGGTWFIGSEFWEVNDSAVISMHVGNGSGDPDHFAWLITEEVLDGFFGVGVDWVGNDNANIAANYTWEEIMGFSFEGTEGMSYPGMGLSNIKLWGQNELSVPEPSLIVLLGTGLIGLGIARRKVRQ